MTKGGNRGGSASKKAQVSISTEDDSFIVFENTNTAKEPTAKRPKPVEQKSPGAGQGLNRNQSHNEDASKKVDTRKLIGGASWTGKLPVNMLAEHCQKQKWAKPEYTMVTITHVLRNKLIS